MEQTKRIQVLDGWHEVTVGQYQEIASITYEDPTDRMLEIVSILVDEDPDEIRKMDLTSLAKIINHLAWTNTIPEDANYKPIIYIDGIEYGCISRLTDLTVGDWIDLEHYVMDLNNNLHNLFAILYRPLITAFNDRDRLLDNVDDFDSRAKLFQDKAMIEDVYGAFVFFSIIVNESTKTMQEYLTAEIVSMQTKTLKTNQTTIKQYVWQLKNWINKIVKVIYGWASSTIWLKVMLPKWKKFLKRTLS